MAKKVLISGISGFIGSHVRHYFIDHDITPIALDRHDLYIEVPKLARIIQAHKPNYIIHLASYGNHRYQTNDTETIMANYFALYNLLKASELIDFEAFINVGSSSMYGKKQFAMRETDRLEPDTFYAATKAGGTYLARAFAIQNKAPIATVVPFSVYGDGEAEHRFIPQVIEHLHSRRVMSVSDHPFHDWIYVKDFVRGIASVIDNIDKLKGQTINIGTGKAHTNLDIIKKLERISGKQLSRIPSKVIHKYDSPYWEADITKLSTLGWKPETTLTKGLKKCYDFYTNPH